MKHALVAAVGLTATGVVVLAFGALLRFAGAFLGELCVPLGSSEHIVLRAAEPGLSPLTFGRIDLTRGVAPEEVPFENPASAERLRSRKGYDAVRLPFSIRLDEATVVSRPGEQDALVVTGPETETTIFVTPDMRIDLPTGPARVLAIKKWAGLLRRPNGVPMIALALQHQDGPWLENVFAAAGVWCRIEAGAGISLTWRTSEADSRQVEDQGIAATGGARWGVVEDSTVHWFSSFAPGTGVDLADGTSVTLVQLEEGSRMPTGPRPYITVRFEHKGDIRTERVPANERGSSNVRFEDPSQFEMVFCFYAWKDGAATLSPYYQRKKLQRATLSEGQKFLIPDTDWKIRVDQVASSAIAVAENENPFQQLILLTADKELHIRQGEVIQLEDYRLEFKRSTPPPVMRYRVSAHRESNPQVPSFTLEPGGGFRYGGWTFTQGSAPPDAEAIAILRAERTPGMPFLIAGAASSAAGLIAIVLTSSARKREKTTQ